MGIFCWYNEYQLHEIFKPVSVIKMIQKNLILGNTSYNLKKMTWTEAWKIVCRDFGNGREIKKKRNTSFEWNCVQFLEPPTT